MDFEKLRRMDPGEWRRMHPELYGCAYAAIHNTKQLYSGNELQLTGVEVDEAIEAAIEVAMIKISLIKTDKCLKPYVSRTAVYKARTLLRKKFAQSSTAFLTNSLEVKLEEAEKAKKAKADSTHKPPFSPRSKDVLADEVTPDYLLRLAELDVLFQELCTMLGETNFTLVWMGLVEKRRHKEIEKELGRVDDNISLKIQRARAGMSKKILGSRRARAIIKELGLEAYLK